ncbi:MAG TPA: hypothetical protein VII68_00395 [Casimicrobiaceae bacterium]|jgi:hypothetical protein
MSVADAVARGERALHGWHHGMEGKVMVPGIATGMSRDALA